jgi:hypothetical protein
VQINGGGEAGVGVAVSGQDLGVCRQQHVVVGQGLEGNFGGAGVGHSKKELLLGQSTVGSCNGSKAAEKRCGEHPKRWGSQARK